MLQQYHCKILLKHDTNLNFVYIKGNCIIEISAPCSDEWLFTIAIQNSNISYYCKNSFICHEGITVTVTMSWCQVSDSYYVSKSFYRSLVKLYILDTKKIQSFFANYFLNSKWSNLWCSLKYSQTYYSFQAFDE